MADRTFTAHLTGEPYQVAWPTAGTKSYKGIGITVRKSDSDKDAGAYQFGELSGYSDVELASMGKAFVALVDALRTEVKRRAEKPADPRDAKIAELEKAIGLATNAINALTAENKALADKLASASTPTPPPAAPSTPANGSAKSAEDELASLPF